MVAPNILRVGGQENTVYVEGATGAQVTITVRDYVQRTQVLHEGKVTLVENQALHKVKVR